MAILYITEYPCLGFVGLYGDQSIQAPSGSMVNAFQTVSISGSSAVSNALNAATQLVKLVSDTNCWLNYGPTNAVAATTSTDYLPAGAIYYLAINGSTFIAAIT